LNKYGSISGESAGRLVSDAKSVRRPLPHYLVKPQIVFDPIWALPDQSMHALGDSEN
jgi:hypothetical protein